LSGFTNTLDINLDLEHEVEREVEREAETREETSGRSGFATRRKGIRLDTCGKSEIGRTT
jgi:hypothetical protein